MNKQQLITTIKAAAIAAFGSENCYAIQKKTGLSYKQIENVYDISKNPTIDTIIKLANAVNLKIELIKLIDLHMFTHKA